MYYDLIQKSIEYIEANLDNEIDTEKAAKDSYISLSNFYKQFFTYAGYTVNEYIKFRRISLAAEDIKSDMRIIDVSSKYQYKSVDAFSRAFKRVTGFLPSAYKKSDKQYYFGRIDIMAEFLEELMTELTKANSEPTLHQLLFRTSEKIIRGDEFSAEEKKNITDKFLNNISSENVIERFNKGVKAPNDGRIMYPLYYIPPYSPKKRITVTGAMPKTHIFSANSYELEILRILAMWRSDDERVKDMLVKTKERLKTTCFGQFCETGECYEASIAALRFIALVFPEEKEWIAKLFNGVRKGGKRTGGVWYYYFLMLSEIRSPESDEAIRDMQEHLEKMTAIGTHRSYKLKYDNIFEPIRSHIARNCLLRFPEYEHLRNMKSYIGADGNKHFDTAYPGV